MPDAKFYDSILTLLPTAFYDFLGYGGGFLSHAPGNNVKII